MSVQDEIRVYQADQRHFFDRKIVEDWTHYENDTVRTLWEFEVGLLFRWVRPESILNIGCGCGYHDFVMARYPFVKRIEAVDYSARSIEKAERHFPHPKIRRQVVDFLQMEPAAPFDLVASFQVIEHLETPEEFLSHCARFCKPGGHVAVFTVNLLRPYNRVKMRYGKPPEFEDPMHKQEFTRKDLAAMGARCGLIPRKVFLYATSKMSSPLRARLWAGYFFPFLGTRLGAVYQKNV